MKEALDQLSKLEVSDIAIGRFHQLFQRYGIYTDRTIIITYEDGKLYLFMPKQYHGAWFKYEIIPVSKETDSTTWIAKNIDERLVFKVEPDGSVRFSHYDVNGNQIVARKIS
ncbi:hypothetical protein AB6A23_23910 [Paenibacillus tarimensis]